LPAELAPHTVSDLADEALEAVKREKVRIFSLTKKKMKERRTGACGGEDRSFLQRQENVRVE
jgi:hypothetical protein